jgi:hypothetical protein
MKMPLMVIFYQTNRYTVWCQNIDRYDRVIGKSELGCDRQLKLIFFEY